MTTTNTIIAIWYEGIKIIPIFLSDRQNIYFCVCHRILVITLSVPWDENSWKLLTYREKQKQRHCGWFCDESRLQQGWRISGGIKTMSKYSDTASMMLPKVPTSVGVSCWLLRPHNSWPEPDAGETALIPTENLSTCSDIQGFLRNTGWYVKGPRGIFLWSHLHTTARRLFLNAD